MFMCACVLARSRSLWMTTKSANCMDETVCVLYVDERKRDEHAVRVRDYVKRKACVWVSKQAGKRASFTNFNDIIQYLLSFAHQRHIGCSFPFRHTYVCVCLYACLRLSVCVCMVSVRVLMSDDIHTFIQYHNWQTKYISFSHNFLLGYGCVLPIYDTILVKIKTNRQLLIHFMHCKRLNQQFKTVNLLWIGDWMRIFSIFPYL